MFTLNDLYEIAVKLETNGESVYSRSVDRVHDKTMKSLLMWMAEEETSHREWFAKLKAGITMKEDELTLRAMAPNVLEGMMGDRTLSLEDVDFGSITGLEELLETCMGFENDTVMFYEVLEIYVQDPETAEGLRTIIREEKKHIETLKEMIRSLE
ncbi:MAG: ferritin family protein [Pseudomonadota bacterium]